MKTQTKISTAITLSLISCFLSFNVTFAQELPQPILIVTSPENGGEYAIDAIELLFDVQNFVFVSYKNFSTLFPGNQNAGHAHMWIDPTPVGATEDTVYEIESPDFHELGELEPGRYDVTIELVKNDHSSFSPKVYEVVSFRVTQKTAAGRYAIIKTGTVTEVGEQPPSFKPLRIIFATAALFLLVGTIGYLKKKGKLKFQELGRLIEKLVNLLVIPLHMIATLPKKIYAKIRRKN